MKKRWIAMLLLCCMALSGCSIWTDGIYVSATPHQENDAVSLPRDISASNFWELRQALENYVEIGAETGIVFVPHYDQAKIETDIDRVISRVMTEDPIASYAVESVEYEIGTNSGMPAIALEISYIHDASDIRRIMRVNDLNAAKDLIITELNEYSSGIVMLITAYQDTDFAQFVEDYATEHPEIVMELPEVKVNAYPDFDTYERVIEIKFTYQTNRGSLRSMKNQVRPIFDSAVLYVSGDGESREKYAQLYSFLTERFDYLEETSITPTYSLLRHGVGDCKAFATVYATMCRMAELECLTVSGTRDGEPWYWNIVWEDGVYRHVDLFRCMENGAYEGKADEDMEGYVWDFSRFPACEKVEPEDPESVDTTETTEETAPETTSAAE